jgi:hypothetical protein
MILFRLIVPQEVFVKGGVPPGGPAESAQDVMAGAGWVPERVKNVDGRDYFVNSLRMPMPVNVAMLTTIPAMTTPNAR